MLILVLVLQHQRYQQSRFPFRGWWTLLFIEGWVCWGGGGHISGSCHGSPPFLFGRGDEGRIVFPGGPLLLQGLQSGEESKWLHKPCILGSLEQGGIIVFAQFIVDQGRFGRKKMPHAGLALMFRL